MLHRPDPLMEVEEIAQVFSCLQESGKVRNFAVSNMQQHQMNFLQHALDMPIVANQIEASLQKHQFVDEGVYAGNADGKDLNFTPGSVEYCRHFDIQIQSWGSLCQGLYTGGDLTNASQADINTSILVNKLAALYDTTSEAIVLAWLLRHPALIQPIIGTTNVERIAASKPISLCCSPSNIFVILICLFVALAVLIPLLEKYQGKMGLDGATKYSKYIWPLVMVSLVVQLIYVLMN